MKKYFYCADVGGTYIKAGIVSNEGKVLATKQAKTLPFDRVNPLEAQIKFLFDELEKKSNYSVSKSGGIAMGLPGLVDRKHGILKFSGNLNIKNYKITEQLQKYYSVPIEIANDADVATIAEQNFGAGKGVKNFIYITVGTGIGGGMVIGGKPLSEFVNFSGEIGHMKLFGEGLCTCGQVGCCETFASTRALVEMTKEAMKSNPQSQMWTKYDLDTVSGKTVFEFKDTDKTAKRVFESFIERLGTVIVNLANVLMPQLFIIGGAISAQGSALTKPLEDYVNSHIFTRYINYKIKIKAAKQTNNSGIIGASCLFKKEEL